MANSGNPQFDIFEGKTVAFGTPSDNLAIKDIEVKRIFDKLFVTGNIPNGATTDNLAAGKFCAILWSAVTDFIIFDSEEEYSRWVLRSEEFSADD